jgi:serine protein kinase
MAAMFAVMSRLEQPKDGRLILAAKAKLYDGQFLPGYTEESVAEMRKVAKREGMDGIEPRFIQNALNEVLVNTSREDGINPFMMITAIEKLIPEHRLCRTDKQREAFSNILSQLRGEYVEIIKTEVQRAIAADEGSVARLCENYIDNIKAYTQRQKVHNRVTGQPEEPNETLMRSIEEKLEPSVSESAKRDFRSEIMNSIGALSLEGKRFDYTNNPRLRKALEKKLFEDQKDTIRLSQITQSTVDQETQEKIDIVKSRLIQNFGYNERSASDVLEYVGSVFARGA